MTEKGWSEREKLFSLTVVQGCNVTKQGCKTGLKGRKLIKKPVFTGFRPWQTKRKAVGGRRTVCGAGNLD
jgi:hypothetical protein